MSVTYQVTVWCECGNWERVETPLSSRARAKLKKVGWSRSGSSDFCPACTKKRKEEKEVQVDRELQTSRGDPDVEGQSE